MKLQRTQWMILFVCLSLLGLAGCVGASGGGLRTLLFAMVAGFLFLLSCVDVITPKGEQNTEQLADGNTTQETQPIDGSWEACCKEGQVSKCFCPQGADCNYGLFQDCGNGTCTLGGTCGTPDTKSEPVPDGTWEACCKEGKVSKCFCPSGAACNYGLYQDCGNGTCTLGGSCEAVPEKKAEPVPEPTPEPAGTWEPCCKEGQVSKCFCPSGAACNYGLFQTCDNGTCVVTGQSCEPVPEKRAEPIPEPAGTWETCCKDGKVSKCFCPQGAACNYGQFKDCGNGACVGPVGMCP